MKNLQNLINKAKEITASGLPFMDGREKGEMEGLLNQTVNITEYGYMQDEDGDYASFIIKEDEKNFYFGGSVLTDSLKKLDDALTESEIAELLQNGLTVKFEKKKSKNKREYTKCTFFPA